jgi:hypothetical protein
MSAFLEGCVMWTHARTPPAGAKCGSPTTLGVADHTV